MRPRGPGDPTVGADHPLQPHDPGSVERCCSPPRPRHCDLFDTTAAHAGIVTSELTDTGPSYAPFQALAASFWAAGVAGLAAPLRFSSNERTVGYYLFGAAGPRSWPSGEDLPFETLLTDRGYTIEDPPTSRGITLVGD